MSVMGEIGKTIADARQQKGWSLRQLALKCEISPSYLHLIEQGEANPTIRELHIIADALETELQNPLSMSASTEATV